MSQQAKWKQFTLAQLKEFAEQSNTQTEFFKKIGYQQASSSIILKIQQAYPDLEIPRAFKRKEVQSKWKKFSKEELQEVANKVTSQRQFLIALGYSEEGSSQTLVQIKNYYPDLQIPFNSDNQFQDLTGQKFGYLKVLKYEGEHHGKSRFICLCENCGKETSVSTKALKGGQISCGCIAREKSSETHLIDMTGQTFGDLTVLKRAGSDNWGKALWICRCNACGKEETQPLLGIDIRNGTIANCGCKKNNSIGEQKIYNILSEHNINFIQQYSFEDLKNKYSLRFDFAIFDSEQNVKFLIEFQGEQHYRPIEYFGGEEKFKQQKYNDDLKFQYCQEKHIPLIIIPYWEKNKLNWDFLKRKVEENNGTF